MSPGRLPSQGGPNPLGGRADALRVARNERPVEALAIAEPAGDQVDVEMRHRLKGGLPLA